MDTSRQRDLRAECSHFFVFDFLFLFQHLSAKDIARLRVTSSELVQNVDGEEAAHWAAKTRDWKVIWDLHRVGDLPLEISSNSWTLERLHLAENPPRFANVEVRNAEPSHCRC